MTVFNLEISESRILEWVGQLSPESKREVLRRLIPDLAEWEGLVDRGEIRIREIAQKRDVVWDRLSESDRLTLVDEILHES